MRWTPGGISPDIEDRRDDDSGGSGFGGFGIGPTHLGIGGMLIVGILSLVFHQNLFTLFSGGDSSAPATAVHSPANTARDASEDKEVRFVSWVIDDVQPTWARILPEQQGRQYRRAKLVLYRNVTDSGCGTAQSATGPFYCPDDEKVYLDLGFFDELRTRFGAPGEFAQAYVIAHEFGHHVQKILGIEGKVRRLQQGNPEEVNILSVALELQADCFAGVWANNTEQRANLDKSEVPQGLQAAASVGDDRLQRMAGRRVSPETFTHGSSAQRVHWFEQGLQSGRMSDCNTFSRQSE